MPEETIVTAASFVRAFGLRPAVVLSTLLKISGSGRHGAPIEKLVEAAFWETPETVSQLVEMLALIEVVTMQVIEETPERREGLRPSFAGKVTLLSVNARSLSKALQQKPACPPPPAPAWDGTNQENLRSSILPVETTYEETPIRTDLRERELYIKNSLSLGSDSAQESPGEVQPAASPPQSVLTPAETKKPRARGSEVVLPPVVNNTRLVFEDYVPLTNRYGVTLVEKFALLGQGRFAPLAEPRNYRRYLGWVVTCLQGEEGKTAPPVPAEHISGPRPTTTLPRPTPLTPEEEASANTAREEVIAEMKRKSLYSGRREEVPADTHGPTRRKASAGNDPFMTAGAVIRQDMAGLFASTPALSGTAAEPEPD